MLQDKLSSRKFWVTVAVGCIVVFGRATGLNIDETEINRLLIAGVTYVGTQGAIDAVKAILTTGK